MRTIKINKNVSLIFSGENMNVAAVDNPETFIKSILSLDVELGEKVTVGDLIHFSYNIKSFIKDYFLEEYEAVRVLTNISSLSKNIDYIRIYKSFKIEDEVQDEFVYLIPEIEVKYCLEKKYSHLSDVPVIIDENIQLKYNDTEINTKTKITLLELLSCIFEELTNYINDNSIISS